MWANRGKLWNKSSEDKLTSCALASKAKQERWSVWSLEGGLEVKCQHQIFGGCSRPKSFQNLIL